MTCDRTGRQLGPEDSEMPSEGARAGLPTAPGDHTDIDMDIGATMIL